MTLSIGEFRNFRSPCFAPLLRQRPFWQPSPMEHADIMGMYTPEVLSWEVWTSISYKHNHNMLIYNIYIYAWTYTYMWLHVVICAIVKTWYWGYGHPSDIGVIVMGVWTFTSGLKIDTFEGNDPCANHGTFDAADVKDRPTDKFCRHVW